MAGVRLQLDRDGHVTSYTDSAEIDEAELLAQAPDLTIGRSRVRLEGLRYHVTLDLPASDANAVEGGRRGSPRGSGVAGDIVLTASVGQALPPLTIRGAGGWLSGYVVPVMSGTLDGALRVAGDVVSLDGGVGYHDHNWGHWKGVSWQWGQVQGDGLSFLYGHLYPPADAADAGRIPGFLVVLGPDGPIGHSMEVAIEEDDVAQTGAPRRIVVSGLSPSLDLTMEVDVEAAVVTRMVPELFGSALDIYQLRALFHVVGSVAGRSVDFTAPGSAETFRGR